jgi:hypothetical protein
MSKVQERVSIDGDDGGDDGDDDVAWK